MTDKYTTVVLIVLCMTVLGLGIVGSLGDHMNKQNEAEIALMQECIKEQKKLQEDLKKIKQDIKDLDKWLKEN